MGKGLLFDASSLIYALKLRKLDLLSGNYIQWLTIYETINGLWKEAYLVRSITIKEAITIVQVLREIVENMNILNPRGHEEEILELALKLGTTVYDASYIVLAKNNNLILVTEDKKLKKKANTIVEAKSLAEIV